MRRLILLAAVSATIGCPEQSSGPQYTVVAAGGLGQTGVVGAALGAPFTVQVLIGGAPAPNVRVHWSTPDLAADITPDSALTDAQGHASATLTLGTVMGTQSGMATVAGAAGSPFTFTAFAQAGAPAHVVKLLGDGQLGPGGAPLPVPLAVLVTDSYQNPVAGVGVIWTHTAGGGSVSAGPPTNVAGVSSVTLTLGATGGDTVTAEADTFPPITFTALVAAMPVLVKEVPVPTNYGIHDTFVRDGLAFVFAWNTGVLIYDVGNGIQGGTPAVPVLVGSATAGGETHNGWWYWSPAAQKKYLFIGQEGPGAIGSSSSGDIHVLDVSNLAAPTEVAFFHIGGAGPHNFWVDETAERLYAAYYNGGVVSLNIAGTLSGDLSARGIDTIRPGGAGQTYVWGVQQVGTSLYAVDMLSGFWQLSLNGGQMAVAAGGNNVPERYSSDLWVHGGYAYTGTWGSRAGHLGNAVKVWQLNGSGAPVLVDSAIVANITTVSDLEVSSDGSLLMISAEGGNNAGFHFYSLADPAHPTFLAKYLIGSGVHTATFGYINGRVYAFGAKDPGQPALEILDVTSLIP